MIPNTTSRERLDLRGRIGSPRRGGQTWIRRRRRWAAPFFDDLQVGQIVEDAPSLTLTDGLAAQHRAIVGDRLRLPMDIELSQRVLGAPLVHPALVWDVAIGQSTLLTQRVIANLFYRGFVFRRFPRIGDTLHTTTEVVALKQNRCARAAPPPVLPRCESILSIKMAGRFWTSGAARCCRCAIPPGHEARSRSRKNSVGSSGRCAACADRGLESRSVSHHGQWTAFRGPAGCDDLESRGRRCGLIGAGTRTADAQHRDGAS